MTLNTEIPNFITHYNRGEPFRSITEVSETSLPAILDQLNETNSWGLGRFSDPEYLPRRRRVEQTIRRRFIAKGGKPELSHPIYFFLGNNSGFEESKRNKAYRISLSDISSDIVSFTYGDSMFSLCENYREKLGDEYQSHLCSQIYVKDELETLFSSLQSISRKLHVECQLWTRPTKALSVAGSVSQ